jgi:predicted nucleic acid-binding protein
MTVLLDTAFLLAVIDADDNLHAACVAALESKTNPICLPTEAL